MESIAGFKAHAPLPVFRGIRFTVLRRISRLFLGLAFVCVSSPLCAVPSMSVAVDDKLCEAWIVECPADYVSKFCASHPPAHAQRLGLGNWQAVASSCVRAHRCRVWAGLALGADLFPLCYMIYIYRISC